MREQPSHDRYDIMRLVRSACFSSLLLGYDFFNLVCHGAKLLVAKVTISFVVAPCHLFDEQQHGTVFGITAIDCISFTTHTLPYTIASGTSS